MFFQSLGSLLLGIVLIVIGCYQFSVGRKYADAATHEASAVGKVTHIESGKNGWYEYKFSIDGYSVAGLSRSCRTALSIQGCEVGAPVRVFYYYDNQHIPENLLQDYAIASQEKLI